MLNKLLIYHSMITAKFTQSDGTAPVILKADAIFHVLFRIPLQIIQTFCAKRTKKIF